MFNYRKDAITFHELANICRNLVWWNTRTLEAGSIEVAFNVVNEYKGLPRLIPPLSKLESLTVRSGAKEFAVLYRLEAESD